MSNKTITCRSFEMPETAPHKNLRKRFGAAIVSGCLALTMCPVVALAQPGDAPEQGDAPGQAMQMAAPQLDGQQQGGFGGPQVGGMPAGEQGPGQDGEGNMAQPPAQPGQGSADQGHQPGELPSDGGQGKAPDANGDAQQPPFSQLSQALGTTQLTDGVKPLVDGIDSQIRQILGDAYGVAAPEPGGAGGAFQPGDSADAPEIPEGEVNVQQVIDTARDILREYGAETLEAKIADADFVEALKDFAKASTEQRLAMFASNARPTMDAPRDLPSDEAEPPEAPASAPDSVSDSLLSQIVSLIADVFGYVSTAE